MLLGGALLLAAACYFWPVLAVGIGAILLLLLCARIPGRDRDRYIPNLYARDTRIYDDQYREFIRRTLAELRRRRVKSREVV